MAHLDEEGIRHLMRLCRIHVTRDEIQSLQHNLLRTLDAMVQLQEVDTENVAPCYSVFEMQGNVLREDVIGELLPRDAFLANAPSHVGGLIKVPPVIKTEE